MDYYDGIVVELWGMRPKGLVQNLHIANPLNNELKHWPDTSAHLGQGRTHGQRAISTLRARVAARDRPPRGPWRRVACWRDRKGSAPCSTKDPPIWVPRNNSIFRNIFLTAFLRWELVHYVYWPSVICTPLVYCFTLSALSQANLTR